MNMEQGMIGMMTGGDDAVSGDASEPPTGAIVNGRICIERLENTYSFECEAGPLAMCDDWQRLRQCFEHLASQASLAKRGTEPSDEQIDKLIAASAGGCYREYDHSDVCAIVRSVLAESAPSEKLAGAEAFAEVFAELAKATTKFPTWPTDPLHALAVLGEEFGELTKDMLQMVYEPHKTNAENVRKEATQTAAMALRLFASLARYEYKAGAQHNQPSLASQAETVPHVPAGEGEQS